MKRPRNTGHRGNPARRRKAPQDPALSRKTRHDATFGDVPLVPVRYLDAKGIEHEWFDFDPDYEPALPKGAVRGNIRKQQFCRMCHVPKYFYVDIEQRCAQCGISFVFGAAEQKFWFESLQFHFDSVATRCPACRRTRRSDRALRQQLADAKAHALTSGDKPSALIALAEAIVRYHQRYRQGSLDEAVDASRKARRLAKTNHEKREAAEALFWEGACHALAGRRARARPLLAEFLDSQPIDRRQIALSKEARAWLADATGQDESASVIYKICTPAAWNDAEARGQLAPSPADARDGFVHLSALEQVRGTVEKHFAGAGDLLVLAVAVERLREGELRWEVSREGARFPHLYGALRREHVIEVTSLPVRGGRYWKWPKKFE